MRLEARAGPGRGRTAAHRGLVDDLVASDKHTVLVLALEVLDSLDGAIMLAWDRLEKSHKLN